LVRPQIKKEKRIIKCWSELVSEYNGSLIADPTLFDLTVELADVKATHIFKAKDSGLALDPIDLRKDSKSHDPATYFESVQNPSGRSVFDGLILKPIASTS